MRVKVKHRARIYFITLGLLGLWLNFNILVAEPLQFAWLSDTHIGSPTGATDLRQMVSDVNTLDEVAFVIISGDITEMDIGGNLLLAKQILDSLTMPYYIIPGNHDTKWSDSGGQRFRQLWGEDKFVFSAGGITFIGFAQGPLLRMADGLIAPHDLKWLQHLLKTRVTASQRLICITHYPLDNSVSNSKAFYDLMNGFNLQMVLCGHVHNNQVSQINGIPIIMTRSVLSDKMGPAGYNLVTLVNDTLKFYERIPALCTQKLWHQQALTNHRFQYQPQNLSYPTAADLNAAGVVQKWTFDTHQVLTASPVSNGNSVFIGDYSGNFYSLKLANGKIHWQRDFKAPLLATAAVWRDWVVFGATDSNIYGLNKADGTLVWQVKTDAPVVGVPTIAEGTVYIGSSDGIFRAVDVRTGKLRWSNSCVSGFVEARPLILNEKIIFGTWANKFYALDKETGTMLWCWQDGWQGALYSPAACYPVASAGKIFIVAPDRFLSCIDAYSGKTLWRTNRYKVRESMGISTDGQTIFARSMQDTVFAIDPRANEPAYRWIVAAGYGYDFAPSQIVEYEGRLYFGTKDGFVYCLDAATGAVQWRLKVGVGLVNTICPLPNRAIVVSLMEGKVLCLKDRRRR